VTADTTADTYCNAAAIGVGAGASLTAQALAATGGEETHLLTVPEMHTYSLACPRYNSDVFSIIPTEAQDRGSANES